MLVPISTALFGVLVDIIAPFYFLLLCSIALVGIGFAMAGSKGIRELYQTSALETSA